jgi:hypothetical protein
MAVEVSQPLKITVPAGVNMLTAGPGGGSAQYTFMKLNASGQAVPVAAATDTVIGVLQNNPKNVGSACEIVVVGATKVLAGGTIAIGAQIAPNASGQAQSSTPSGYGAAYVQGTKQIVGYLYTTYDASAAASGDVCTVVVNCLNPVPGT